MQRVKSTVLTAALLLLLAGGARADGFLVPTSARQPVRGPWAVKDHRVTIEVNGQRAVTEVRQTFVNLTRAPLEVKYLFPVPEGAMIEGFTLIVDGTTFVGKLLPAAEAIRIYESIVRQKKDPGLLTYAGRGLVETRVFPLPAGGTREVVVRYEELLGRNGDMVRIHYPLDTERFSARPIERVSVDVDIVSPTPIKAVYSPSHQVEVTRPSETRARVSLRERNVLPDSDLLLFYSLGAGDVGASLFTYRPPGEKDGHFLLLVNPRSQLEKQDLVGKNLVVVLDHSGSMQGEKIMQAKEALRYVVNSLTERDTLDIIAFSSATQALFSGNRTADGRTRERALSFVNGLSAGGGTDILSALSAALSSLPKDTGGRQNTILFLTDGLPTVGVQNTAEIVSSVTAGNDGARLFVFGVGYDVNAPFLDRLVEENGGVSENIRPKESVEVAVTGLFTKIKHTVLTNVMVKMSGIETYDVYPRRMPDLFAGSQLVLVGRYRGGGRGSAIVAGETPAGKRAYRFPLIFETASDPDEKPFVSRIWATTKIGFLLDQMRVMDRREPELVDEVVRLSVEYGIVTEYTAFLADESNDFRDVVGNREATRKKLSGRLAQQTGGAGANQAINSKRLRHQRVAQEKQFWADDNGRRVDIETVRNVGRKTFYRREGVWVDREIVEGETVEEVSQLSARFFDLVRGQTAAENRWLSFREPVLLRLNGRNVKINP
jgi:Ca-activated chloride channel homolog